MKWEYRDRTLRAEAERDEARRWARRLYTDKEMLERRIYYLKCSNDELRAEVERLKLDVAIAGIAEILDNSELNELRDEVARLKDTTGG
jgi:hypothetical protein